MAIRDELHYLRAIHRRLLEFKEVVPDPADVGFSLGHEALADEIDWLDCFIDKHQRKLA
jgi:hypothetical protein